MGNEKRKAISASLRWSVFARDNFTCRYCGAQAGQDGIQLHADHVISVAEGGDSSIDNLVTACQRCNGGKGARSMSSSPSSKDVIKRLNRQAKTLEHQADAIRLALEAEKQVEQQAINLKCAAFGVDSVHMEKGEVKRIVNLCRQYGADNISEWYSIAAGYVNERKALRYVHGIINQKREKGELPGGNDA